jgi:hypothetical protein
VLHVSSDVSLEIVRAPEGEKGITSGALSPRGTFPDPHGWPKNTLRVRR